jgi:hypothetical protein
MLAFHVDFTVTICEVNVTFLMHVKDYTTNGLSLLSCAKEHAFLKSLSIQ